MCCPRLVRPQQNCSGTFPTLETQVKVWSGIDIRLLLVEFCSSLHLGPFLQAASLDLRKKGPPKDKNEKGTAAKDEVRTI